jgi:hypothetical protein
VVTLHGSDIAREHRPVTTRLEDGRYDAFVVWAERRDDAIALECTITAGEHRGEVVNIVSASMRVADELSLVGMPCTLIVRGDVIGVELA